MGRMLKKWDALEELLGEEGLEKNFQSNLTKAEEATYLNKVDAPELREFLASLIEDKELMDELTEDDDKQVVRILNDVKHRERLYFSLPNILMLIGLVSLLVILTLRVKPLTKINNICTLMAFLSVISSFALKNGINQICLRKLRLKKNNY